MSVDFKIMDRNFAQKDVVNIGSTSEDVNFPASNVKKAQRSRVWRSSGYFEITSSINKIDFKDSAVGAEMTATIPVGNYSTTGLATQIGLSMGSVGAATYTVTYSESTGKWTVATSSTFLSLLWSTGTNTATAMHSTIGFSVSDDTGSTTYTGASVALHTVERLVVDLISTNEPVDSFAAVFAPESFKLSDQAVVKLRANATNVWTSPSVDVTLTLDENTETYIHFFSADQAYRYWAIEVVDPKNANLHVELSKIILSKATDLGKAPNIGFVWPIGDPSTVQRTPFGHRYFDNLPNRQSFQFDLTLLTRTQVETLSDMYARVGSVTPVAISLDSQETLFDKDRMFIYGYLDGDFPRKHVFQARSDIKLEIEEAF